MITKVIVPQKGLSDESCVIQEWKKREGDRVEKGEIICEVETNKAVFEVEAPASGVILKILHQQEEEVPVLEVIALIGEPGEEYEHLLEKKGTTEVEKHPESEITQEVKISPRAHQLALKNALDIAGIKGSGPGGRMIERDVQALISAEKPSLEVPPEDKEKISEMAKETPVKGIRKMIAERMFHSLKSTAQLTLHASFQANSILDYRSRLKESPEESSYHNININHLIMFGVVKTLKEYPEINSHYRNDRIIQFNHIHLGFAVDTAEGLKVPVVHQAERYSLEQFSRKVQRLTRQCINRTIQPEDLEGGTFTITNLGNLGIEYFTPILNVPQTAILGIGCKQVRPIMKAHSIEFATMIGLSLTFDHRAIDGAPAARFLGQLISILEEFNDQPHQKP